MNQNIITRAVGVKVGGSCRIVNREGDRVIILPSLLRNMIPSCRILMEPGQLLFVESLSESTMIKKTPGKKL